MSKKNSSPLVRLDQLLVSRGWGSRKEVSQLIRRGQVQTEEGVVRSPKLKLKDSSELWVNDQQCLPLPEIIMYHKPLHVLSTYRDPWGRAGLDTVLPPRWRSQFHPVGRLDADTTGLLLFSRKGQLTHQLLHPKKEIPRTYEAYVEEVPVNLVDRIAQGVSTTLGTFSGEINDIQDHKVTITVCEGKHRMVRRMLHNAGASVLKLHRLSFGSIQLGTLEEGSFRALDLNEYKALLNQIQHL